MTTEAKKDYAKTFEVLGVELTRDGDHARGDCPLCGKDGHFFLNRLTGQWDCKVCAATGNAVTFMGLISEKVARETSRKDLAKLAENRGLPPEAFAPWGLGWTGTEWWIPVRSERGTVRDIRRFNGSRLFATPGCHTYLWNAYAVAAARPGAVVWVCEGEWDGMALAWLLKAAGRLTDAVVAVPGASIFKNDWVPLFKTKNVRMVYDNDAAGEAGMRSGGGKLKGTAATTQYVWWPAGRPAGFDIRDFVKTYIAGGEGDAVQAVAALEAMLHPTSRADAGAAPSSGKKPQPVPGLPGLSAGGGFLPEDGTPAAGGGGDAPVPFTEVVRVFKKWCFVDRTFEDALASSLCLPMSNTVPGDPLWMYLVGPASSGKSIILTAMAGSEHVVFHSSLTPKALVSGFNVHPDPSLLPTLDGKTAVFKDGTELLAAHPEARRETFGILRGAYDGRVDRKYGNGVERNYILHFSMLMGVTDAIHAEDNATMGERFLEFYMPENPATVDRKIRAAISGIAKENDRDKELSDVVRRFLLRRVAPDALPVVPEWAISRVIGIAQILGKLRARVTREAYDREMAYRPTSEVGIRAAKQLTKFLQMLTVVLGRPKVDAEAFRIMLKVAENSSIGFHFDAVKALAADRDGLTMKELGEQIRLPSTTLGRRLEDLQQLEIVYRLEREREERPVGRTGGALPSLWKLTKPIRKLWEQAYAPLPPEAAPDATDEPPGPPPAKHLNGNGATNGHVSRFGADDFAASVGDGGPRAA